MKLLRNNVLVTQAQHEEVSTGGIILTGSIESGVKPAVVLEVGPDVIGVGEGDKVYLHWNKGMAITHEGEQAAIISEEHIEAVI